MMKKTLMALALAGLCFAAQSARAISINLTTAVLQDENGNPLPDGTTLLVIVSTSDASFGNLVSSNAASATQFPNEADDVILKQFTLDSGTFGVAGGHIEVINFNLGFLGIGPGDPVILAWYPGLTGTNNLAPGQGQRFGTYRAGDWVVPGDDGADLNWDMVTSSAGGPLADSEGLADQITFQPAPNVPPVAQCQNVTVPAGPACTANVPATSVDNGSFDPDGTIVSRTLTPAGPYPLGTNSVVLTVTDDDGATDTCSANIIVVDSTAPVLSPCPANITVASDVPVPVSWSDPTATDNCDPAPTVVSTPPSGSLFGPGVTTVTCVATDAAGNTSQCQFTVTVTGSGALGCIPLVQATNLKQSRKNALISSLTKAQQNYNEGKTRQACAKLRAFILRTSVYQRVGLLDSATAAALIGCAESAKSQFGCN